MAQTGDGEGQHAPAYDRGEPGRPLAIGQPAEQLVAHPDHPDARGLAFRDRLGDGGPEGVLQPQKADELKGEVVVTFWEGGQTDGR